MIYIYIFNGLKNSIELFFVTDENDMKFVNEGLLEQSHTSLCTIYGRFYPECQLNNSKSN